MQYVLMTVLSNDPFSVVQVLGRLKVGVCFERRDWKHWKTSFSESWTLDDPGNLRVMDLMQLILIIWMYLHISTLNTLSFPHRSFDWSGHTCAAHLKLIDAIIFFASCCPTIQTVNETGARKVEDLKIHCSSTIMFFYQYASALRPGSFNCSVVQSKGYYSLIVFARFLLIFFCCCYTLYFNQFSSCMGVIWTFSTFSWMVL